jgi:hypothetical protein
MSYPRELRFNGVLGSSEASGRYSLSQKVPKAAHPPRIHRGFIGLCDNASKRAL